MGALAFQEQVENLAAVTRGHSLDMPRTAEVLTLERVSIVRKITRMTERTWQLRSLYIVLARDVPAKGAVTTLSEGGMDFGASITALNQLLKNTEAPTLTDVDGDDIVEVLYGLAAQYAKKSADDGRYIRRHANKLREAGDACDIQRVKVYARAKELLEFVKAVEQGGGKAVPVDKYKYDDIFNSHLANYPVTMDYLAR